MPMEDKTQKETARSKSGQGSPRIICHGIAHRHDIVEGPMANDTIYNYVQDFIDGKITRTAFWELAKFKHPTHQICFCTERALPTLSFLKSEEVSDA